MSSNFMILNMPRDLELKSYKKDKILFFERIKKKSMTNKLKWRKYLIMIKPTRLTRLKGAGLLSNKNKEFHFGHFAILLVLSATIYPH